MQKIFKNLGFLQKDLDLDLRFRFAPGSFVPISMTGGAQGPTCQPLVKEEKRGWLKSPDRRLDPGVDRCDAGSKTSRAAKRIV